MNRSNKSYQIHVEAQIDVEIDGEPAKLTGQGDQLHLIVGGEETLFRLLDTGIAASQLAQNLVDLGLTVTVTDEQQSFLKMGYDVSSRLSKVFTGSRYIAPASLPGLIKLLRVFLGSRNG